MQVACLLVADFLVALARRDDPSLRGQPVIVGGSPEEHAAVVACSPEAVAAGVGIGTTLRRALALCPKAVFLPHREGAAAEAAGALLDLLRLYSPAVEAIAPGHAHLDIHGLAEMARMADAAYLRDLQESAENASGLPVSLAAADTVFAAHAAATVQARGAMLVHAGEARAFLGRLPVEVLPVSPLMHQRLRLFGLNWLGQVAELTFSAMQAQFGREGARAWELANGRDDARIVPRPEEVRVSEELELPAPAALSEPLIAGTRALLLRALERREIKGHSLRRLDWRLGLESGEQLARRCVFREPTNDAARMLFALQPKIERLQLPAAAVSVGVTLSGLCSEYGHQANLWQVGPRRHRELLEAVEQLNARVGGPQVFRIVEVQGWSRIPERQLGMVAFGP